MVLFSWFCSIKKTYTQRSFICSEIILTSYQADSDVSAQAENLPTGLQSDWASSVVAIRLAKILVVAQAASCQSNTKAIPRPSVGRKCNEMYTTQLPFFTAFWEDSWQKRGVRYCGLITVFAWKALVYYPHIGVSLPSSMASGSFEVV